ncbi:MAG: molybdopterin-dependent oxidoreductase, partial [bacterium]|nr:molybdopterin-dependent oxidoreductase [bacterium]
TYKIIKGNTKKAFRKADVVVEKEFRTNYQVHAYLEPQGMVAEPRPDRSMNIYGSMQCPFYVLDAVSVVLGFPKNRITVIQAATGGGFGGKEDVPSILASHAALMAYHTARPVKLIYDREEDFQSMSKRHPGWARVKYGARKDGRLLAAEITYIIDAGAYSTLSPIVLWRGTVHSSGPYNIPNVRIQNYAVATNKVPCGAFRGFGQPQISFAQESLMDELAIRLNISPARIRQINGLKKGDRTATSHIVREKGTTDVLDKVLRASQYHKKQSSLQDQQGEIKKGIGLSLSYYGVGLGAAGKYLSRAGAFLQIENDGSVRLAFGNTEMGQGAKTVLAQIAAQALNAPYPDIYVMDPDTSRIPDSGPTVASRTTFMSGNAILDASRPLVQSLKKAAAGLLQCKPGQVVCHDTGFYYKKKKVSYPGAVSEAYRKKYRMSSQGWYVPPEQTFDDLGQGSAYYTYTYSANAVELEVNIRTGEVKLIKVWAAHDIGKAINPQQAEAQIQGGVLQGIGYALYENLIVKNGIIVNPNFTGYIIPTIKDAPEIVPVIVENRDRLGPFGARGLGEPPLIGLAPAIANAIRHATGIRLLELPMVPEKILEELNRSRNP